MLIGNLDAHYDETGSIITSSGYKVSPEQLEDSVFRAKKDKAVILANRLNSPIPPVSKDNVDEILQTLTDEAASLSIREKDNKNLKAEDLRGLNAELYVVAGASGNKTVVSQIIGSEDAEDQKNKKALDLIDKATGKNIRIFEGLIHNADSSELVDLENKTKITENLELKGINIDVNDKSESSLNKIVEQLLENKLDEPVKENSDGTKNTVLENTANQDQPKNDISRSERIEAPHQDDNIKSTNSLFSA